MLENKEKNMKNVKKVLSVLMATALMQGSFIAYASPILRYEYEEGILKLDVKSQPNSDVFVLLTKKDADINDDDNICAIVQNETDENGIATISLHLTEDAIYDLYVDDNESEEVAYSKENSRDD